MFYIFLIFFQLLEYIVIVVVYSKEEIKFIINNEAELMKNITQSEFEQVNKILEEVNAHQDGF
ncbi:hypothetical protein [Ureibacillus thermosphaericus]|uniref:Uncharacterized protein n=1 Tax=Ureibacillus thermosphaericus TaxID=51173 RepID=A0A840PZ27_URETH|nr:hypothetical protein [Ureibacillus thermosphaericus]MBB5149941.1 hypothetical protein [Ureibacillus thermosphaericus]NKZ32616.1 hypothetical protein [Ureibacillus thermosphaericus]